MSSFREGLAKDKGEDAMEKYNVTKQKQKVRAKNEIEPVHGQTYCRKVTTKSHQSDKSNVKADD